MLLCKRTCMHDATAQKSTLKHLTIRTSKKQRIGAAVIKILGVIC